MPPSREELMMIIQLSRLLIHNLLGLRHRILPL